MACQWALFAQPLRELVLVPRREQGRCEDEFWHAALKSVDGLAGRIGKDDVRAEGAPQDVCDAVCLKWIRFDGHDEW